MGKRPRKREDRIPRSTGLTVVLTLAVLCVMVSIAGGGLYMVMLLERSVPVAEDDDGHAVEVDELRQVVLHFDDDTWAEFVMHRDDVDRFIRGVRRLDDDHMNGIVVYRMRRGWPSAWTREELGVLFGNGYAPVYDWSLQESVIGTGE